MKGIDRPIRPENQDILSVERFYQDLHRECDLSRIAKRPVLDGCIVSPFVHRPGLALTGFTEKYPFQGVQIIGEI